MFVIFYPENSKTFESLKELFEDLFKEGYVVKSVEDNGSVKAEKDGAEVELLIGEIKTEAMKELFIAAAQEHRESLRAAIKELMSHGVKIPKKELDQISAKFEFLPSK